MWSRLISRPLRRLNRFWLHLRRRNSPRLVGLALLVALLGAVGFYMFERPQESGSQSLGEGLWWAVVTMTTTGYGDIVPKTMGGRLIAVFIVFAGMGLLSVITATMASVFVTHRIKEERGLEKIDSKGHIVLCGWNENAEKVIEGLTEASTSEGSEVVFINDLEEELINEILFKYRDLGLRYVRGDFSNEMVLRRANIQSASAAIILADTSGGSRSDERAILATLAIKSLKPEVRVCAEIIEPQNEPHLRRASADDIIIRGEHNAFLLSAGAVAPGMSQVVRQLLSHGQGSRLRRLRIPSEYVGKSFGELFDHFRQRRQGILIGLVCEEKGIALDDVLSEDYSAIDAFIKRKFSEAGKQYLTGGAEKVHIHINPGDDHVIQGDELAVVIGEPT